MVSTTVPLTEWYLVETRTHASDARLLRWPVLFNDDTHCPVVLEGSLEVDMVVRVFDCLVYVSIWGGRGTDDCCSLAFPCPLYALSVGCDVLAIDVL